MLYMDTISAKPKGTHIVILYGATIMARSRLVAPVALRVVASRPCTVQPFETVALARCCLQSLLPTSHSLLGFYIHYCQWQRDSVPPGRAWAHRLSARIADEKVECRGYPM